MGKNGSRQVLVNSKGKEMGELDQKPAVPGKQPQADHRYRSADRGGTGYGTARNGAIVAMDPRTGEILAMVSRPTFDPNDFAVRISTRRLEQAGQRSRSSAAEQSHPGATGARVRCSRSSWPRPDAGRHRPDSERELQRRRNVLRTLLQLLGAERRTHGSRDLTKAIYQSCDVFFYTLAEKLGIERIAKYATGIRPGSEDGHRSAGRSQRRHAVGRMEDPQFQAEVVCGRNHFSGHRAGRGGGNAGSVGAGDWSDCQRRTAGAAPCRQPDRDLPPGIVPASDVPDEVKIPIDPGNWEIDYRRHGRGGESGRHGGPSASAGHRLCGENRQRADYQQCAEGQDGCGRNKANFKDNGWFAGVEPRRNPEIVVCTLLEEANTAYLAARTGGPGHQGLRGQAAPATHQGGG